MIKQLEGTRTSATKYGIRHVAKGLPRSDRVIDLYDASKTDRATGQIWAAA